MTLPKQTLLRAAALCAALLAASATLPTPPLRADGIDDQIKAMKDLEKSGDDGKCIGKMQELKESVGDKRVIDAIKELAKTSKNDKVACAAIKMVANLKGKDLEFLKWLIDKVDDKDLQKEKDGRPDFYKGVLDGLPPFASDKGAVETYKSALPKLVDVVKKYVTTNDEYSTRAIRAYGVVPEKAVVEQLITWLEQIEARRGGSKSGGGGGGKHATSTDTRAIEDKSKKAILETLTALTGQDISDGATWKKWWGDNAQKFAFPDPNKKEDDVDVTKLTEWTDSVFNYKVVRPDGAGWTFQPKNEWFRIQVAKIDDKKVWWCHAGWGTYKVDAKIKDPKSYADWWLNEQFAKEFDKYSPGGEPKQESKKFAGHDWLVVSARGEAKDKMLSWQVMQRIIYITKLDAPIFYAAVTIRTTAEKPDQDKIRDFVEGITFTK